ncbi:MAG: hypothetical protein JOZ07_11930 [Solirubrobacterales bacterium]|nr:hypothetical protein [Solirubrobacterales bacterium]
MRALVLDVAIGVVVAAIVLWLSAGVAIAAMIALAVLLGLALTVAWGRLRR